MRLNQVAAALALAGCALPGAALADDPADPAMRSQAARERDRAMIRQLNRDMLAQVQARDAGYAGGWRDYRGNPEADADYRRALTQHEREQARYAEARRRYEADMADWRREAGGY